MFKASRAHEVQSRREARATQANAVKQVELEKSKSCNMMRQRFAACQWFDHRHYSPDRSAARHSLFQGILSLEKKKTPPKNKIKTTNVAKQQYSQKRLNAGVFLKLNLMRPISRGSLFAGNSKRVV